MTQAEGTRERRSDELVGIVGVEAGCILVAHLPSAADTRAQVQPTAISLPHPGGSAAMIG
jgi:hypothetical protein